jgi:hypothetical protein
MQPRLRWSGYLTVPNLSDAQVRAALSPFFIDLTLWRARTGLPADWPSADDPMIRDPPAGLPPIWGEGVSVSTATVLGDPETPWRLLVGSGQLVIEAVWLLDTRADPWPTDCPPCPPYPTRPPGTGETVTPPSEPCHPVQAGVIGVLIGGIATLAGVLLTGRRL